MNTSRIGIAGDWHGDLGFALARIRQFAVNDVQAILHVGDFGVWHDNDGQKYVRRINKFLSENNQYMFVTLGNHENYNLVDQFKIIENGQFAGWMIDPRYPNLMYAQRGQRWSWEGVSFVSLGGANSIDRFTRTENISWWAQEQISYGDVMNTINGGHADIFIAHDCPEGVALFKEGHATVWKDNELEYAQHSRVNLRYATDEVKPEILFHGHYHNYLDVVTNLEDGEGTVYPLRTVGLDMNGNRNNTGILELPSKKFSILY